MQTKKKPVQLNLFAHSYPEQFLAPCPVTIRGITYPSQGAAARALKVPASAISKALDLGTLDNVGLGRNHDRKQALTISGVHVESVRAAARWFHQHGHGPEATLYRKLGHQLRKGKDQFKLDGYIICRVKK